MSDGRPAESILAADVGSTCTHVCLLDRVEGVHRLVARAEASSSAGFPDYDLTIGLRRAIVQLEEIVQRSLLDEGEIVSPERDTGTGVDLFLATCNAAPPLQCAIVGLTDALSVKSAQRTCATANVLVTQTISLGERLRRWDDQMLITLRQTPPDIVLLVGGLDTGPIAPLENAARVLTTIYEDIPSDRRPIIIFAGNQEARRPVSEIMSSILEVRVVDNVCPNPQAPSPAELQRELAEMYERIKLTALPGYRRLRRWCRTPILSTTEALGRIFRFLAQCSVTPQGFLGADVGGATTYVGIAEGDVYQWSIGSTMGTSYGVGQVLARAGVQDIARWLPGSHTTTEVANRIENIHLRPNSIPQTSDDVFLNHAIVRQALSLTMEHLRPQPSPMHLTPQAWGRNFALIAARGGALVHTAQDSLTALTLLDALQPVGFTQLITDWASLWPQLGVLVHTLPSAAAQVLERDGLRELGTVISLFGTATEGEKALHIRITSDEGEVQTGDILAGTMRCFALAPGRYATVEARPSRAFGVGSGPKGTGAQARVRGGTLGIIVDARGRPLQHPEDPQERSNKLQQWLASLDLEHAAPIPSAMRKNDDE
jgi:hypothetical protein